MYPVIQDLSYLLSDVGIFVMSIQTKGSKNRESCLATLVVKAALIAVALSCEMVAFRGPTETA